MNLNIYSDSFSGLLIHEAHCFIEQTDLRIARYTATVATSLFIPVSATLDVLNTGFKGVFCCGNNVLKCNRRQRDLIRSTSLLFASIVILPLNIFNAGFLPMLDYSNRGKDLSHCSIFNDHHHRYYQRVANMINRYRQGKGDFTALSSLVKPKNCLDIWSYPENQKVLSKDDIIACQLLSRNLIDRELFDHLIHYPNTIKLNLQKKFEQAVINSIVNKQFEIGRFLIKYIENEPSVVIEKKLGDYISKRLYCESNDMKFVEEYIHHVESAELIAKYAFGVLKSTDDRRFEYHAITKTIIEKQKQREPGRLEMLKSSLPQDFPEVLTDIVTDFVRMFPIYLDHPA